MAGYETFTIDLSNPIIIDDNGLKVTAFKVIHDPIEPALGFRFDYKGRSIVISGDTISTENTIKNSINADVLFHEAQANHIVKILENENKKVGNKLSFFSETYSKNLKIMCFWWPCNENLENYVFLMKRVAKILKIVCFQ